MDLQTINLLYLLRAMCGVHIGANLCFQEQLILDFYMSGTAYWIA